MSVLSVKSQLSGIVSRYGSWPPQIATDEMLSSLRDKETDMSDQTLSRFIDELRTYCDQRNKMRTAYPDNFSITNADIKNEEGFCLLYNQFNAYLIWPIKRISVNTTLHAVDIFKVLLAK